MKSVSSEYILKYIQHISALGLALIFTACSSSIISVDGRMKSNRETPYYEQILLAKLPGNSIVTVTDDMRGGFNYYVNLYDDTLGLRWSTRIPVDREHPVQPLWLSKSPDGIALIYSREEENDSITISGSIFDPANGGEKKSLILKGFSLNSPRHSTILPPELIASPDSSKFIIYQVDNTELKQKTENESIEVTASVYDSQLRTVGSGTLRTKMDRDVPGTAEETTHLHSIMVANDGRVYQITGHGPSTLQVRQWDPATGNQQSIRWTIPGEDLKSKDRIIMSLKAELLPTGNVIVAVPLMSGSSFYDTELTGIALAEFDFSRKTLAFSNRFDLTEEVIEQLTGDDELEFYWLTRIIHEPSTGSIILPFEHVRTVSYRDKASGQLSTIWVHQHLLILAFDQQGKQIWKTFVERSLQKYYSDYVVADFWKVDSQELQSLSRNDDDGVILVNRFSTATGTQLPPIKLISTDLTPWHSSSTWMNGTLPLSGWAHAVMHIWLRSAINYII